MVDEGWLQKDPMKTLIEELVAESTRKYRIPTTEALRIITEAFIQNSALFAASQEHDSPAKLRRTGIFKNSASAVKKSIYFGLRNYRKQGTQIDSLIDRLESLPVGDELDSRPTVSAIIEEHASTRERLGSSSEFYDRLFETVESPASMLDIGCGVHPLMFPFSNPWNSQLSHYVAVDKSAKDIRCVNAFSRMRQIRSLKGFIWDISDHWSHLNDLSKIGAYDLALMMKVVPVVNRQQREILANLHCTPAKTWIVTGSRIALAKNRSIERRERKVLEDFIANSGRKIIAEFSAGEEFALVAAI